MKVKNISILVLSLFTVALLSCNSDKTERLEKENKKLADSLKKINEASIKNDTAIKNSANNKNPTELTTGQKEISFKEFSKDFIQNAKLSAEKLSHYTFDRIQYVDPGNGINKNITPDAVYKIIIIDMKKLKASAGKDFIIYDFAMSNRNIQGVLTGDGSSSCSACFFKKNSEGIWKLYKVVKTFDEAE